MSSPSEPESEKTSPAPSDQDPGAAAERAARPRKKKAKAKRPIPKTEEEIDSPNRQSLGMLGVIGVLSLVLWAFARGGCNYHPPKESRDPRKVDLAELAREPKDAALELQQRWATSDFAGAAELAKGPLLEQLVRAKAACDASCLAKAAKVKNDVRTVASLLERDPFGSATARVVTNGAGNQQRFIVRLEREGQLWKAVQRDVDDGSFKPRPAATFENMIPIRPPLAAPDSPH